MSTKTTFKRVALVAVAALGLGVLSVVPSQAAVSGVSVTVTNGATSLRSGSTTLVNSDSTTGATISVSALTTNANDSITVAFYNNSTLASGVTTYLGVLETSTSNLSRVSKAGRATHSAAALLSAATYDSSTSGVTTFGLNGSSVGNIGANFELFLDSKTASQGAGTYSYTFVVTVASVSGAVTTETDYSYPVSIVVSAPTTDSTTPSAAQTVAYIGSASPTGEADVAVTPAAATASTTAAAYVSVYLKNASGTAGVAKDTITVSIAGPGLVYDGTSYGKSLTGYQTGTKTYSIVPDGNAGVATVTITTARTAQSWTKSVNFYASKAAKITTSVRHPLLKVGTNTDAVQVTATDASGNPWTGTAYIVASSAADALIAGSTTPQQCSAYTATNGIRCSITGVSAGTAKFKVIDKDTVATANALSDEFSVTVSTTPVAGIKVEFDKASYGPYEKAKIIVSPVDAAGNKLPAQTLANAFATGGITASQAFSGSSDTLTPVSITSSAASSSSTGAVAGSQVYTVYMPAQGDVTLSWTGGTSLPLAGQVAGTTTASVVNNAVDAATDAANEATDAANAATDAALAAADAADAATAAAQDASDAVAALSAEVSKMIASLKAQITSLTNLVIKIQKKVKA